ncbi:pilus assembly protein [Hydrogenophilus thermoluteolus]|uniref:Pilus assembly protein n=1 Tax=Hydrogenophilus thermoluteolus TaxID=297 RepID=A0A2Z6DZS9_HYDTE|nr:PilC/PilY family type IV pilus protein [Hydrogenophilus thermoluteolus]BBD77772.1 pilus assembly protein [Hydrogenophilus thermoluteolus]
MRKVLFLLGIIWLSESLAATIPNVPPFVSTSAFANVMIDMSVETPMGGAAYADQAGNPPGCTGRNQVDDNGNIVEVGACFFPSYTYLGIFDPNKCYSYSKSGGIFLPGGAASLPNHTCSDSAKWSGNFLNWATMTAIDLFIWTMTGGDREIDDTTQTVLQRARAIDNASWFPVKYIANAKGYTPWSGPLYITNHSAGGYQFKAGTSYGGSNKGTFNVKVKVCVPGKGLEANCKGYTSGGTTVYKPEGLIQRYADKMRFGVFAYTNDNSKSRDGGVLRAPMRYVGEKQMDASGNLVANAAKEINPATGQIYPNPLGASGGWSGVINYINRFHRDGYKSYDPIGEMFYEVIRYFKKLPPTPEYAAGAPGGSFPIYTTWNDPIQFSCQKNFVVAINDANPWLDKKIPGTFFTCDKAKQPGMPASFTANDCGEPSNPDSSINVSTLTQQVGEMEGLHTTWTQINATGSDTVGYVFGVSSNAGNCNNGKSVTVTNLAQVMGTCPYAPKQNSYYISGLAYYANTTDLRPDLPGKQSLNSFFIDTQEYSLNPLSGNRNMLYLAGKYGGFTDLNGNNRPDLPAEWDVDGDGMPDNYVFVSEPSKLVKGLERAFSNILEKSGSASNVTANSTQFANESLIFQALFNSGIWSGDLLAYPISSSGVGATPTWKASEHIPAPSARKIYTRSGGNAVEFFWSNLSSADQTALGSADVLDFLRGERSKELQNGGTLRNRAMNNILGDIVHSSPFYVKDTDTVYVGANDGMLHAFNASSGEELFAYIPSALISKLKNLSQPTYTHDYFVDGDIVVSNRSQTDGKNYLVATLGRGGKGLFGLDVTNPNGFSPVDVKWECFDSGGTVVACNGDPDLGYMLGRSVIAKMNNGDWAVIVGNGYNSTSGKAVLYIFDLATGAVIKKIDTGVAGDNGLAPPAVVDEDNDGDVDVIYAGDLKGNVWKFDVSSTNTNQWKSAFMSGATPQPFFVAMDSAGNPQPITAQITVAVNPVPDDPNYNKRYLFFGTGSYFRSGDPGDTQVQSWYGLIDEGTPITGRSDLKQRSIESEGTFDGKPVRTFGAASAGDMVGKKGWFVDFTTRPGERIVTASKLFTGAEPVLIASSIIPKSDPCLPGGDGFDNAINPFTGGRLTYGFFDLNDNKDFSDDTLNDKPIGGVDLGVGMPSEPVIVGDRLVVGGSRGTVESVRINVGVQPFKGRISWREIILEN